MLTGRHGDEYAVTFGQPEVANGFYGNMVSNVWSMADEWFVADVDVVDTGTEGERRLEGVPVREVRQSLVAAARRHFR